jgi:hypothetical protein
MSDFYIQPVRRVSGALSDPFHCIERTCSLYHMGFWSVSSKRSRNSVSSCLIINFKTNIHTYLLTHLLIDLHAHRIRAQHQHNIYFFEKKYKCRPHQNFFKVFIHFASLNQLPAHISMADNVNDQCGPAPLPEARKKPARRRRDDTGEYRTVNHPYGVCAWRGCVEIFNFAPLCRWTNSRTNISRVATLLIAAYYA